MSKVDQLTALRAAGIAVPRTVAAIGPEQVLRAARSVPAPFVTKHNQGGKGLGVHRFDSVEELAEHLAGPDVEHPVDGITLVQEYVQAAEPRITRVEIVAGELVYAISADTARGGFQLCPADACALDPATGRPVVPPGATLAPDPDQELFTLREDVDPALVQQYLAFADRMGLEVCGIEFIEAADGRVLTYDVNTNTNYNASVEAVAPRSGPRALARHLGSLAARLP
nr:hypothetical protein [Auraticoccus cholistanensis]